MSTPPVQLDNIDWDAALATSDPGAIPSHVMNDALSLSALFTKEFHQGITRVMGAREAEPLNPLHVIRQILLFLRFGKPGQALELSGSLQAQLPGLALPAYLRALATHREGEFKRAANAAAEIIAGHPAFIPARFLQAESQLRLQFKGLQKLLTGLPRGEGYASSWLDLTAKLVLSGSEEGQSLAAEIAANPAILPRESREQVLALDLLELSGAGLTQLEERLGASPPGTRSEELVLLFYGDRLDEEQPAAALERLRRLWARFPDRAAVCRVYVARLTRLAVELSVQDKHAEALRLVERCLQLEPHETVHYQNRAALFTLLRESEAYHDAWYELDRHQFRLALLGRFTPADALELAKPHRLFAQQARLPGKGPTGSQIGQDLGFLMETIRTNAASGASESILAVNNDRIDEDPELLRQWVHHRRAELTFVHWALGLDPRRFLLDPDDVPAGRARLAGLVSGARSLELLVPDEGRLLADRVVATWRRRTGQLVSSYAPPSDDPEVYAAKLLHLETFSDLALLCLTWKPSRLFPGLMEELLAFLQEEAAFFDDALLLQVLQGKQADASYALKFLVGFINDALGLDASRSNPLSDKQRAGVSGRLAAEMLIRMAYRTYEQYRGTEAGARNALVYVERARSYDPENVRTELTAARFLLIAGHDDEVRATLAKLQRSARAREPDVHSEIEELRRILNERAATGAGSRPFTGEPPVSVDVPPDGRLVDLEAEIDQFPGAIQAYEELVRKLAATGRFSEAIDWSERAMTQCLERDGQLRARALNMEVLGLGKLWEFNSGAVQLYVTGAHRPALDILESNAQKVEPDHTLGFLLGQCRLALGRTEEARLAFERALEQCGRQLHRTVLRGLAMDVDQPFLLIARRTIAEKMSAGALESALRETWRVMVRLRRPEAALVDVAQIHLEAVLLRAGAIQAALPAPTSSDLDFPGGTRLAEAYSHGSDLERARHLARLGLEAYEPCRRKAEVILRKADALEVQAALAQVLGRSGDLLRQGNFAEALDALNAAGPAGAVEPRVVRQRALLLLKLERFQEAEETAKALESSTSPVATEFLESFPSLLFRQRVAAASRMLCAGESAEALAVLEGAVALNRDQAVELAYCRGFALTMDAFRLRRACDQAGEHQALRMAMDCVEPQVAAARASGHTRLLDLYETLDKELDHRG